MSTRSRLDYVVGLVDERGFISVKELSRLCQVTETTIRRDLERLDEQKRLRRTFGGAVSLRNVASTEPDQSAVQAAFQEGVPIDAADALIAALSSQRLAGILPESVLKKNIPIIAESLPLENAVTCLSVDNYQAGKCVGRWAGEYARDNFGGQARVLDLTYHLANTHARSRGFLDGLREVLPNADMVLSINGQSRYALAYQLTRDALAVHPQINVIFAINDTIAWGAVNACQDLRIDPKNITVIPFGLEGDTLKNALIENKYVKGGLAMFPEIVGPACVEAAIAAFNKHNLPSSLVTPFAMLTIDNLDEFYGRDGSGWVLRKEAFTKRLFVPINIDPDQPTNWKNLPQRIGFVIPFRQHEWYQSMIAAMQAYAAHFKIIVGVVDAEQSLKDELEQCRREIARTAAKLIAPGDVVIIDGGPIAFHLAENLAEQHGITVITNSVEVFDTLAHSPGITLISTGGILRHSSRMLVGPTAENTLRDLRADKLFLSVTGISLNFGLSHTNIPEVTIKQTMLRSSREVILLADHTCFGHESVIQVAPTSAIRKVITDEALPASNRLDLTKLGIEVILTEM